MLLQQSRNWSEPVLLINNTSFDLARNNDLLNISTTVIEQQNILMYPYQLYPELKWSHDKQSKGLER